jgi:hypothetical protein
MNRKHLKISTLIILCSLVCFGFILGCKSAQLPNGPYDVPTVTPTTTNTTTPTNSPTPTATLGPVNVSCYVNYGGSQTGVSWNVVDPNGNTINTTAQTSGGTPFLFTPSFDGIYSVNIPTQTRYLYSSQPLTIAGAGNYSVTFSCSGQTLSTNPTSIAYSSSVGYQIPVTVSYSYSGNLDVPVSIQTSGLSSAFGVSPSYVILNTSGSMPSLTVTKNSCDANSTSLNLTGFDLLGGVTNATSNIGISKNYSIPVSILFSSNTTIISGGIHCPSELTGTVSFEIDSANLLCSGSTIDVTYSESVLGSTLGGDLGTQSISDGVATNYTLFSDCGRNYTYSYTVNFSNGGSISGSFTDSSIPANGSIKTANY